MNRMSQRNISFKLWYRAVVQQKWCQYKIQSSVRTLITRDLWIALEIIDLFVTKHAKTIKFLKEKEMHGEKYQPSSAFLWTKLRQGIIALELILQST